MPAPDRVGHEEEQLRLDRHPDGLGARERHGRLERLDASPERRRQDAVDLLERALGMVATGVEPEPSRRGEPDRRPSRPRRRSASAAAAGSRAAGDTRRRRHAGPRPGSRAPGGCRCSAGPCGRRRRGGPRSRGRSRPGRDWSSSRTSSRREAGVGISRSTARIEGGKRPIYEIAFSRTHSTIRRDRRTA